MSRIADALVRSSSSHLANQDAESSAVPPDASPRTWPPMLSQDVWNFDSSARVPRRSEPTEVASDEDAAWRAQLDEDARALRRTPAARAGASAPHPG
jgi:hypothetical protein